MDFFATKLSNVIAFILVLLAVICYFFGFKEAIIVPIVYLIFVGYIHLKKTKS
ncbi:hypothetical protein [Clostridium manihotivorum]|uniref:hypothetical protein n=1 Tax=Clostridium manihotivorum TaxID=2320868 RepID=UPI0013E3E9E4|nr:hypothetical protein [Clostridium manihotivorum]